MTGEEAKRWIELLIRTMREETGGSYSDPPYKDEVYVALEMALKALEQEPCEDRGEVSDGYHTFNQLYYQRAILFATIVNLNKDKAWKSFKHFDGNYCFDRNGEWFIVGIDTPKGSYTYHYSKEYWDIFDCEELECGKEWDGHTEEDVIRLLSLEERKEGRWLHFAQGDNCPFCGWSTGKYEPADNFCPHCGAKLKDGEKSPRDSTKELKEFLR